MLDINSYYEVAIKKNIPCPDGWTEWPKGVPLKGDGSRSIDLEALKIIADIFAKLEYPLLVFFTCGTTIGQAIDNIKDGSEIVEEASKTHNVPYWVHVDAALFGAVMPFINNRLEQPV